MASFDVVRRSQLPAAAAWSRLTDWKRHGELMPLTSISVSERTDGVATAFVARTSIGRLGFDDPMEVTVWRPPTQLRPGVCSIVKTGRVVRGGAQLTVTAVPDGSLVRWHEEATLGFGGQLLDLVNRRVGQVLFGRLIDGLLH